MRGRSRSSFRSSRAPKRRYVWDNAQIAPAIIAPGIQGVTDLSAGLGAGLELLRGWRVERVIGRLRVNSTDATFAADFVASISMRQQSQTISASLTPFPFLWWIRDAARPSSGGGGEVYDIDVKSKRAFRNAQMDLMFAIENNDSTQSLEFVFGLRVLYSMP